MNKNMNKILVIVAVIYVTISIVIAVLINWFSNNKTSYLYLYPNNLLEIKDGVIIESEMKSVDKIFLNENGISKGIYKANFSSGKIVFSNKNGNYELNSITSGLSKGNGNKNILLKEELISYSDRGDVNDILRRNNINNYELNLFKKISFDLENDGKYESIYLVSNLFNMDDDGNFSLVYTKDKDDNILYLKDMIGTSIYEYCIPSVNAVYEINNNPYLILKCEYFDNIGFDYYIYKYEDEKFTLIKEVDHET